MAAGPTYEPIATTTLGSAAASITFSSIAATYTDLKLILTAKTAALTNIRMQFNSDTAANYSFTYLAGSGTAAISAAVTGSTSLRYDSGNTATGQVVLLELDILSYAGSANKTVLAKYSNDNNGSGFLTDTVGLWRSTAAITSLVVYGGTNALDIGTTATLYGIKAA